MRRMICLLFTITLLFSLCACSDEDTNMQVPAKFYYCSRTISYDSETGVIDSEVREIKALANDITSILNLYLEGPRSDQLTSPFPDGSCVERLNQNGTEVTLLMSKPFTQLTGLDLTLAFACLSKTVFSLTDAQTLTIRGGNINLDGNSHITLTRDSLLLLDENHA